METKTMRYHYILSERLHKKMMTTHWKGWRETGSFVLCCWVCKMVQLLWEIHWFLKKLKCNNHKPINFTWAFTPKKLKHMFTQKTCTQLFLANLFVITKKWKWPQCPSTGDWLNKLLVHSFHWILLSNTKEKLLIHSATWMNLHRIMLSEKNPTPKCHLYMTSCIIYTMYVYSILEKTKSYKWRTD